MPTWLSTLLFIVLVAAVMLLAMYMFGVNPFATAQAFIGCIIIAFGVALVVVLGLSWKHGLPRITRSK